MYILDSNDNIAAQEIIEMQIKRHNTFALALSKEKTGKYRESLSLYRHARLLSLYSAKTLKPRVFNEVKDQGLFMTRNKPILVRPFFSKQAA